MADAEGAQPPTGGGSALIQIRSDVARIVGALDALAAELAGIKTRLDRIEEILREIALGLGVKPT